MVQTVEFIGGSLEMLGVSFLSFPSLQDQRYFENMLDCRHFSLYLNVIVPVITSRISHTVCCCENPVRNVHMHACILCK